MNLAGAKIPTGRLIRVTGINVAIGLFCAVFIAGIWAFTLGQIRFERNQAADREFSENSNLAVGFEELTQQILQSAEQTLRLIDLEYARQGVRLDIRKMFDSGLIDASTLSFTGVVDERGKLILGGPDFKPVDVADRDYYQFHQQHATTEMNIGKPLQGRVSNRWVVPLTRRMNNPDGSFAGVAYASLDPAYFNRLFEQAKPGEQGVAMLVGLDGISRARRAGEISSTGQDMKESSLFAHLAKQPVGHYVSTGKLEGVVRYISYRTMTKYPLVVAIGTSQPETIATLRERERKEYTAAALVSGLIVLFGSSLIYALSRQKRGVEALYASNARFGVAFNQAAVGVAMADLGGRFLEVNAACCRMLGYTTEELLARGFLEITHPDDRQISADHAKRMLDEHDESSLLEKRYVRKDGGTVWVLVAVSVVHDSRGEPQHFMAVVQDITERKRAELVLADEERRFRALIENAADAVLIVDRNGLITYGSPAVKALGGYELEEIVGRNFLEFVHPDEATASRTAFEELRSAADKPRSAERRFRHKDGSWIVLETIANNALDDPTIQGIVINARDITARKHAEQALLKINRAHKALTSCNSLLVRAANEQTLIQHMCDNIVENGGYKLTWVGTVEHDEPRTIRQVAYAGYQKGFMENAQITWGNNEQGGGPAGMAIKLRKLQVVQNAHVDPTFRPWQANAAKLGYGSVVALPLISLDEVLGVLTIYSSEIDAFDTAELRLLNDLADDLAFGIVTLRTRLAHENGEIRLLRSMEGTILAMAATLEMRDAYTAGHQRRVAELSVAIAREMGMPEDDVHGVHLAAVIHDLGKIQVPAEILSKPTRLSRIEYELIKTHPEAGYAILKDVEFPWPIAQMVYQHHERLDGSGYPRGLKDAEILIGAKILAVADTVEAMASHRPYRAGLGVDKALEEIIKNSSITYDAAVVDACVLLFREKRFAFQD